MSSARVPLSVLDLVPVSSGSDAREALRNSVDLAQRAEALGYARYWLTEHHLNAGNAGSASLTLAGILAAATSTIRVGTAAILLGHWSPLQVAEAAGVVATLFDGRMDLGLGRTLGAKPSGTAAPQPAAASTEAAPATAAPAEPAPATATRTPAGLLLPAPVRADPLRGRFGLLAELALREPAIPFADAVESILQQLDGTFTTESGGERERVPVLPAEGSGATVWIHGSSGGESARLAGRLGLPFGANYHSTPSTVLEAVDAYREAFVPGRIPEPHVIVSADVLVAETSAEAARLGLGFDRWVLSVRGEHGTMEYPTPAEAAANPLTADEAARVQDRVATRFVGAPEEVVAQLAILQHETAADELLLTTSTHAHEARVRSYELLAEAWKA